MLVIVLYPVLIHFQCLHHLVLCEGRHVSIPSCVISGTMSSLRQPDIVSQDQSHMLVSPVLSCFRSNSPFSNHTIPLSLSLDKVPSTSFQPYLVHEKPLISNSFCGCFDANYNQNTFLPDIKKTTHLHTKHDQVSSTDDAVPNSTSNAVPTAKIYLILTEPNYRPYFKSFSRNRISSTPDASTSNISTNSKQILRLNWTISSENSKTSVPFSDSVLHPVCIPAPLQVGNRVSSALRRRNSVTPSQDFPVSVGPSGLVETDACTSHPGLIM